MPADGLLHGRIAASRQPGPTSSGLYTSKSCLWPLSATGSGAVTGRPGPERLNLKAERTSACRRTVTSHQPRAHWQAQWAFKFVSKGAGL